MTKYIKSYIITCLLCLTCVFSGVTAFAQSPATEEDPVNTENMLEPGIFFPVAKELSSASVYSVSGELLKKTPASNITNTLYGLVPGLFVQQGSGEYGNDAAWMNIRGIGAINYTDYVIFVDGFQAHLSYLQYMSPSEIENISVFKDAAALAPFGMKGANGIIWVETKKGRIGKPKIQAQFRTGIEQPMKITKPLGSYDYAMLYNEAISNDNGRVWNPIYSPTQLENYKNGTGINTDWYDNTLKSSGQFNATDLTFDGGVRNAKYFIMLGMANNNGLYDVETDDQRSNLNFKQFSLRSNLNFTLYDIFEGKIELGGRINDKKRPNISTNTLWNVLERYPNNIYPVSNEDGSWTGTQIHNNNPVASITDLGYVLTHDRTVQANLHLKEKLDALLPGLYISQAVSFSNWTRGTYTVSRNYERWLNDERQTTDQNTNYSISDDSGTNQWDWKQFQASAGYDGSFGNHTVSAVVNYLQNSFLMDANQNGSAGVQMKYNFQNIGGRVHYAYNGKYVGELGFGYSGSDNYAKGNRWGFYPAISGAWILSKEDFLADNTIVNFLKLRLSAGKSAYDPYNWGTMRRYIYQQYYVGMGSYPTGNAEPSGNTGLGLEYFANPDIFAEESMKYNFGLETNLFNGLRLTADAFLDKRSGILFLDNTMTSLIGVDPPMRNVGKTTTKGIEADLTYSAKAGKFHYSLGGNLTYLKDKIDFMAELAPSSPLAARTGYPISRQIGYEWNGFYDVSDFNVDGTLKSGVPVPVFGGIVQPGDLKYKDIDNDGVIDEKDMLGIGRGSYPSLFYAFHAEAGFAGFDFRILFQGVGNRDISLSSASNKTIPFLNNGTVYEIAQGRWAYYPEQGIDTRATATYPRLSTQLNDNNNTYLSSFWVKNGNFLRLRNVEIGYNVPKNLLQKIYLDNVRIFVGGSNLFTFSQFLKDYDIDPESMTGYPALKALNVGITIGF